MSDRRTGKRPKRGGPRTRKLRQRRVTQRRNVRKLVRRARRRPARAGRPRWWRAALLVVFGGLLGFAIAVVAGYRRFADEPGPLTSRPVAVSWPEGLDAAEAAGLLADLELTDAPAAMEVYLRATAASDCFQPGPHLLPGGASPRTLVALLCRQDGRATVKLTIPEGFHRFAIAERLETQGVCARGAFLHASANRELLYALGVEPAELPVADTAEGYLFPATYRFALDSDPAAIVSRLVKEANRRWKRLVGTHPAGWERLQAELELGRRQVLTLASMVEKEAVVAPERPIIASVFINRLQGGGLERLQSDPTAIYGCHAMPEQISACQGFDGKASPALNRDPDNLFSTYVVDGLPPGPIANPGAASIEAVLAPADTEYLYFVAKGQGQHEFSEDYAAHKAAVKRLRERQAR